MIIAWQQKTHIETQHIQLGKWEKLSLMENLTQFTPNKSYGQRKVKVIFFIHSVSVGKW